MRLRDFKTLMISRILYLKKTLMQKYPDQADRINYITELLVVKTYNLRTFTLPDYLHTLYLASKEFPEFEEIIPPHEIVEQLLKEE